MFLPGKYYTGPKTESNQTPLYRDNAVLSFLLTHLILIYLIQQKIIDAVAIVEAFPSMVSILTPSAFIFCICLYIKGLFIYIYIYISPLPNSTLNLLIQITLSLILLLFTSYCTMVILTYKRSIFL